jgi:predicted phosphodiesterase
MQPEACGRLASQKGRIMGWTFDPDIEFVNLVGYLTSEAEMDPPRMSPGELQEFLYSLSQDEQDITNAFISSRKDWIDQIRSAAGKGLDVFRQAAPKDRAPDDPFVPSELLANILKPLRKLFTGYSVYALVLPTYDDQSYDEQARLFREIALLTEGDGLALMPRESGELFDVLEPFPALRALAEMPVEPPAVVFWSGLGAACALELEPARAFFHDTLLKQLRAGTTEKEKRAEINRLILDQSAKAGIKRVLHISDLHFGDQTSDSSRRYIKSHLDNILCGIDRVVVTGDLFNSPDATLRNQFLDFRSDVERMTNKELILIPGNHDVRPRGNAVPGVLPPNYEFIVDIGLVPLLVDDDLCCVFFCFNSVEEGNLARGCVTASQRMRMAALFNEECARRRRRGAADIDKYIKIALVHHHPFTYETIPTARYDKMLRKVTGDEDSFTRLEDADEFVSWCAEKGVSIILHGHKHVPYHIQADVEVDGRIRTMMVVGCGSTTGAEGSALCYDVVSLNPTTRRWGVTFHRDPSKSGAGFRLQRITVDGRSAKSVWE